MALKLRAASNDGSECVAVVRIPVLSTDKGRNGW